MKRQYVKGFGDFLNEATLPKEFQEEVAELNTNPNVGGMMWKVEIENNGDEIVCTAVINSKANRIKVRRCWISSGQLGVPSRYKFMLEFNKEKYYEIQSTTMTEALLKALEVVKEMTKEFSKELGMV